MGTLVQLTSVYIQIQSDEKSNSHQIRSLLENIESKRKRIGGKSVPDEKMCGQKAQMYLDGKTKLELGFYEMAYIFNYLKVRTIL